MPTKFLGVSLAATIAFAIFLILPALFAGFVISGEIDAFRLGVSTEPTKAYDSDADIGKGPFREASPAATIPDVNVNVACEFTSAAISRADLALATNISTPLDFFGNGYYSYVISTPTCDDNLVTIGPDDFSPMSWFFEIDPDELVESEVLSFIVHTQTNLTFSHLEVSIDTVSTIGSIVLGAVISDRLDNININTGERLDILIGTQERLLVQGLGLSPGPGERIVMRVTGFLDFTDLPASGEVVIFDAELSSTRDQILTGTGSIILFNVVWSLVAIPVILAATPWITWRDIVTLGRGRRGG